MKFDAWIVDASGMGAVHESGFRVEVEGNPKNPNAVHPGKFPAGLDAVTQVRLLRMGVEAIAAAARERGGSFVRPDKPSPKVTEVVKAKSYTAPENRPKRATLSLKPKTTGSDSV